MVRAIITMPMMMIVVQTVNFQRYQSWNLEITVLRITFLYLEGVRTRFTLLH